MMTQNPGLDAVAQLTAQITEAAVLGQAAGLRLLYAEMQALTQVMPGQPMSAGARITPETDTEAAFDNMPV